MTEEGSNARMLIASLTTIENRLFSIEQQLYNKLRVAKVIDISDNKVHMDKQIVKVWETPDGVMIHIK